MKWTCRIGLLLGTAAAACATVGSTVTFYRDVLPILQNHCQSCHRPGHIAPMAFMTYKETRPWAEAIKYSVTSKQMPPWFGERPYVPAAVEEHGRLTMKDIETLVKWVEQGAPAGDPKDAPPPVYYQQTGRGETLPRQTSIPIAQQ